MDLNGKVAVVTGTANAKGIGMAACRRFADSGAALVLADIDADGLESSVAELKDAGVDVVGVATDMSDLDSVRHLADEAYRVFGRADLLLLNHVAGGQRPGHGLLSPAVDAWEAHVRVNLMGVLYGIKSFLPRMVAADEWGYVLATVSGAAVTGLMYGNGPYAVTKSAITTLMECLYGQLRDVRSKIGCGVVVPGLTNTMASPEIAQASLRMLRETGFPATLTEPEEVADSIMRAISDGQFWAHPGLAEDTEFANGRHRETIEWGMRIYQTRADALINRQNPDPYLWGPPSDVLG